MRFFRFVLWTSLMVGLGIFLARYKVFGRTPVDHAEKLWNTQATQARVHRVEQKAHDAIEDAKVHLPGKTPREHHSADERSAVNHLIAERAKK